MTDIIREVHEDSSNTGLIVIIAIVVLAIAGFLVWRFMPAAQPAPAPQSGASINITLPNSSSSR